MIRSKKQAASDHFDGERFFNPGVTSNHRLFDLLRWRLQSRPTPWPVSLTNEVFTPPPFELGNENLAITFIGHASFLVQLGGLRILIDPIFSERCSPVSWAGPKRVRPPGLAIDDLPPIDLILVSHNHYDHMDLPTLRALQSRDAPPVITPLGNTAALKRAGLSDIEELDWWGATRAGDVEIIATPAQHFSARSMFDRNRALWAGFMLKFGARRVFFAGDSGFGPHWEEIGARLGRPTIALLPIGAYEPRWFMAPVHMNPEDAVQAHLALGAERSIGMHFGTFQLTDEGVDAPLIGLHEAAQKRGVQEVFTTLGEGETWLEPE